MQAIVDVVVPVFAIMLAGYLCGRFRVLGEASSEALNRFVYFVALPALFLVSMSRVGLSEVFNWPFLGAFCGGMAATFLIAFAVARIAFPDRLGVLSLHGLAAIFSNTGYMGIPLLVLLFDQAGLLPAVITTVVNGVVVMGIMTVLLELDLSRQGGHGHLLKNATLGIAKSPLVISACAGLLLAGLEWPLPKSLATFCDILGAAAGPCALFAIGLFMAGKSLRSGLGEVAWVVALKLVAQPLITWWLAFHVFALDGVWGLSAVIQAALPTGALAFVLAQQYGLYVQRATSVILISTVVSLATLSALFLILDLG